MNYRIADDARFALLAKVRQARMMSGKRECLPESQFLPRQNPLNEETNPNSPMKIY